MDEVLIEKAGKTTIQILHDEGLFHKYENAGEVTKIISLVWWMKKEHLIEIQ